MIAKKQLVHGAYYNGNGRGTELARWNADTEMFRFNTIDCGFRVVREYPHPDDQPDKHWADFYPEQQIDLPTGSPVIPLTINSWA